MKVAVPIQLAVVALLATTVVSALDVPKPADPKSAATQKSLPMPPAGSAQPRVLEWNDLIPLEQRDRPYAPAPRTRPLFDDETGPAAVQDGSSMVNKSLEGEQVKLPGFVVPLTSDENVLVTDFLLVPYFGACIHTPPPPPNQIVYVAMKKPFRLHSMYAPVWVTGKLSTKGASAGALADAAYSLAGVKIENYEEPP